VRVHGTHEATSKVKYLAQVWFCQLQFNNGKIVYTLAFWSRIYNTLFSL